MTMHKDPNSTGRSPLLVFVHGFLDNRRAWLPLAKGLAAAGYASTAVDLRGAGTLQSSPGPYTLNQAVEDVLSHIGTPDGPVVMIGHSMGAQIAELAAAKLGNAVAALVLMTPTPLAGNTLPDEVRSMLRESGGDADAQQGIRRAFSRNLSDAQIRELTAQEVMMGKDAVRGYYDAFAGGDACGKQATACACPVLILGAEEDPVIAAEMVRQIHGERFPGAALAFVANSGHWPQLEQCEATLGAISNFLQGL